MSCSSCGSISCGCECPTFDWCFRANDDATLTLTYLQPDGTAYPVGPIAGFAWTAQILDRVGGSVMETVTVDTTDADSDGILVLRLTAAQTVAVVDGWVYGLLSTAPTQFTWLSGLVRVSPQIVVP